MPHSLQSQFKSLLLKPEKSLEDAQFIYEKIRGMRFFEGFFATNLRSMDTYDILTLCQGFQYEEMEKGRFVFQRGDESNNKFYIILSGRVGIIAPSEAEETARSIRNKKRQKKILKSLPTIEIIDEVITPLRSASPKKQVVNRPPLLNQASFEDYSKLLAKKKTLKTQNSSPTNEPQSPGRPQTIGGESSRLNKARPFTMKFGTSLNHIAEINEHEEQNNAGSRLNFPQQGSLERLSGGDAGTLKDVKGLTERESAIYLSSRKTMQSFDEEIAKYGKLLRDLETGESFGDLALLTEHARSASVLCKTDCEFLVVTKDQFDSLFLKKEEDKEQFLKTIFPFLTTDAISQSAFSMLLYSFKTEVYTRGSYLTIEGNPNTVNPKFFALQHGECVVEKTLTPDVVNNDKNKITSPANEAAQIAVVGKGMLIGEEVLQPHRSYEYNVKAVTDHVVVYSITRFDFEAVFFKEFQALVLNMYLKKKKQREIMFEVSKKEYGQQKGDHLYYIRSPTAKVTTPMAKARSGILRNADRESKAMSHDEATLNRLLLTKKMSYGQSQTETSLINDPLHLIDMDQVIENDSQTPVSHHQSSGSRSKDRVRIISIEEMMKNPKRRNLEARIDFLRKMPGGSAKTEASLDPKEMEKMKFFKEKDPKKIKVQNILKAKLLNINLSPKNPGPPRHSLTSGGIVSPDLAKSIKRLQSKSQVLAEIQPIVPVKTDTMDWLDESPMAIRPFSPKVNRTISLLTKLQESPMKSKPVQNMRVSTASASTATFKTYNKMESRGFDSYASSPMNAFNLMVDTTPSRMFKTMETEGDSSPRYGQKNRLLTPNDYLIKHVLTIDGEEDNNSSVLSPGKGESRRGNRGSKTPAAIGIGSGNLVNLGKVGSGAQTPSANLHLKKKVEFRKKVFKKTSLKSLDLRATPMKGFSFMVNTLIETGSKKDNNKVKMH